MTLGKPSDVNTSDLAGQSVEELTARLEEARWWHTRVAMAYMCDEQDMRTETCQRIADLAHAVGATSDVPPTCDKGPFCMKSKGHDGECDDIPF